MTEDELKKTLDKLSGELKGIDPGDAEKREMLNDLIGLIESKLRESGDHNQHAGLMDKLKEKAAYFDATHPRISSVLEEIIAVLVRLGI